MTSLAGQWIAPYTGTNTGILVIELDEIGDHYEGTACAWDNGSDVNSMVSIRTPSKDPVQGLRKIPVKPMDHMGKYLQPADMEQLKSTKGIHFPDTVDVDLTFDGLKLSAQWLTSIGTAGAAVATMPKTKAGLPSDLIPLYRLKHGMGSSNM